MAEINGNTAVQPVENGGYGTPDGLTSEVNRAAYAYWLRIRGDRAMPSRADLVPADIVALLPNIILLDIRREPLDFRYRLIGTYIAEHSAEHTGRWMSGIPHQAPPSRIWTACRTVAETARPICTDIPYVGRLKDFKRLEDVMMPLSDDGHAVDKLFICADFL